MTPPTPLRILVADDQALVRSGIRLILETQPGLQVVAEAGDGVEAVQMAREHLPDIVLMDIRMPRMDGIAATARVCALPGSRRVLVLTTFDQDEHLYEAVRAGASGFLLKTSPPEQLVAAVRAAAAGDTLLAPSIARRLLDEFVRRPPPGSTVPPSLAALTEREREVLRFVARGLSNGEIAGELVLSEGTVKSHVHHLLAKLGARDRVQAVVQAYESGLVRPGDR